MCARCGCWIPEERYRNEAYWKEYKTYSAGPLMWDENVGDDTPGSGPSEQTSPLSKAAPDPLSRRRGRSRSRRGRRKTHSSSSSFEVRRQRPRDEAPSRSSRFRPGTTGERERTDGTRIIDEAVALANGAPSSMKASICRRRARSYRSKDRGVLAYKCWQEDDGSWHYVEREECDVVYGGISKLGLRPTKRRRT